MLFREKFHLSMPKLWPPRPSWFERSWVCVCQATIQNQSPGDPAAHTDRLKGALTRIGFPIPGAHEFFAGLKPDDMSYPKFVEQAMVGLALSIGSAPIVVTPLDMERDEAQIRTLLDMPVEVNGVVNLRILVTSDAGIVAAARLMREIGEQIAGLRRNNKSVMPAWWPIIQGVLDHDQWRCLREQLGADVELLSLIVNPWTLPPLELHHQIVAVQVPVGSADGIKQDGIVALGPVKVTGALPGASYNLPDYLKAMPEVIRIILGPTPPDWDDTENLARIARVTGLLHQLRADPCATNAA